MVFWFHFFRINKTVTLSRTILLCKSIDKKINSCGFHVWNICTKEEEEETWMNWKSESGTRKRVITFYCHYVCLLSAKEDWIIRLFFNETKKKNEMKCTRNEEREKKKQMEIDTMFPMFYLKSHYKDLSPTKNPSKI